MTTPAPPFDELVEYAKTLAPAHPITHALWRPCPARARPMLVLEGSAADTYAERAYQEAFHREKCSCKGSKYVPRPHAEAALVLQEAIEELWPDCHIERRHGITSLLLDCTSGHPHESQWYTAEGHTLDALSTVVHEALKEQKEEADD